MKCVLVLCILAALCGVMFAAPRPEPYGYGFPYYGAFGYNGDAYNRVYNAQRQLHVNAIAVKHGAGIGTAPIEGVPGTAYSRPGYYPYGYYPYAY